MVNELFTDEEQQEQKQEVFRLNMGLNSHDGLEYPRTDVKDFISRYLEAHDAAPDGATFLDASGLWRGTFEASLMIDIWVNNDAEKQRIAELKQILETRFNQDVIPITKRTVNIAFSFDNVDAPQIEVEQ